METKFQTSFIPKKPITQESNTTTGVGLFLLISIVIFLISSGIAGWVYLEKNRLIGNINEQKNIINKNKDSLNKDSVSIENFVQLNTRIETSKTLLSKHISVAPLFGFLGERILKNVRFNSFVFSAAGSDATGANKIKVDVSGKALDWRTMAAQADEISKPEWKTIIVEPKISNLSLSSDGSVMFSLSTFLNPNFVTYKIKK
ncbi:MAG: hypothetical protein WC827_01065 [Candidatus Paceibacterota bacterium]|jgi:hypothetical protein